ncbi:hypothetical protein HDV04_002299, partial [Boothiomyces sp. JEL0838]
MEGGAPAWKPQENSVLVSFGITKKKAFRKPVWDYYCGDGFKSTGGSASCFFKAVDKDYTFFDVFDAIRNARFVVSPPGEAIDCYRTYEALLLGSYPIVKTSVLDPIFEDLPVLIVKDLTKVTALLLEETYINFRKRKWKFEKLYHSYWQSLIWEKRIELGGPGYYIKYKSELEPPKIPLPKSNSFVAGTCGKKADHYFSNELSDPKEIQASDRLSLVGFQHLGELYYGSDQNSLDFTLVEEFLECLHPYTTIFVETLSTKHFISKVYPKITVPVILISGGGIESNPNFDLDSLLDTIHGKKKKDDSKVRDIPNIAHWYLTNCIPESIDYPWMSCIPIGLKVEDETDKNIHNFIQGHREEVIKAEGGKPMWKGHEISVLVNFKKEGPKKVDAWEYFCGLDFKLTGGSPNCFYKEYDESFTSEQLYNIVSKSRFVVCPREDGYDSQRIYEALLLGSFPIVESSPLDSIYLDLPVLIVDKFKHVTAELLEITYRKSGSFKETSSATQQVDPYEKLLQQPIIPWKKTCGGKSDDFRYPKVLEAGNIRMEDRFSQIGIKHMAELTHTNMPTPENFTNPWSEFMTCYEPYTIIYLESWTVKHFLKHILPKLTVPVILITGDGDTSNPEIDIEKYKQYLPEPGTKNPVIAHWFAQHCRPDAAKHKWITCIPLGINQWLQTREKFQLYAQTYGHLMNPMEGGAPAWKPQENSVLVSFGITKKKAFRKP